MHIPNIAEFRENSDFFSNVDKNKEHRVNKIQSGTKLNNICFQLCVEAKIYLTEWKHYY